MGTLPVGLVAENYYAIYETYYQKVDPSNQGTVSALNAAKFLKSSGLSDVILSKIWDLADSNGKGYLTKSNFFVALKLIALVQAGKEPISSNLSIDVPPPKMGDNDKFNATVVTNDWTIKPAESKKYDDLFDSLNPSNGLLPGIKVKGLLMDSKLSVLTLGKIWDLADIDKDGALDRHEFSVAMHLVYKALEKYTIPSSLPPELLSSSKRKDSFSSLTAVPVPADVPNEVPSETLFTKPTSPLLVTPILTQPFPPLVQSIPPIPSVSPLATTQSKPAVPLIPPISNSVSPVPSATTLLIPFNGTPLVQTSVSAPLAVTPPQTIPVASAFPMDNLLSPVEESWVVSKEEKIKYDALFEQADLDRDGFVSGFEIKDTFLKSGVAQPVLAHIWQLCDTAEQGKLNNEQFALALWLISRKLKGINPPLNLTPDMVPPSSRKSISNEGQADPAIFTSPEVDRLTKEIDDLVREKLSLETNITQQEADIKIKAGEIISVQNELNTLVATLKQLENQKGVAVKRISDLKTQKDELDSKVNELNNEFEEEREEVNKLRHQAEEQERNLKVQESELSRKKQEMQELKNGAVNLEKYHNKVKKEIEDINIQSTESVEIINEIKSKLIELKDFQLQIKQSILHLDNILESNNVTALSEIYLNIEPKFQNESYSLLFSQILKVTNPVVANDPFASSKNNTKDDSSKTDMFTSDPVASQDPFGSSGFQINKVTTGFTSDPFASFESQNSKRVDQFAGNSIAQTSVQKIVDSFGGDPFAILHAPSRPGTGTTTSSPTIPRAESPSPALPPKKCKQPPPRPAPPRPAPPSLPSDPDVDFADFSNFSYKIASSSSKGSSYSTVKRDVKPADPFRDYRYDDPFDMDDEVDAVRDASPLPLTDPECSTFDPFAAVNPVSNGLFKSTVATNGIIPPEDQQLAWATTESVRSEKERRKRAEQVKADMKKALKLSKADSKKRSSKPRLFY